jgi:hypothetical protein
MRWRRASDLWFCTSIGSATYSWKASPKWRLAVALNRVVPGQAKQTCERYRRPIT